MTRRTMLTSWTRTAQHGTPPRAGGGVTSALAWEYALERCRVPEVEQAMSRWDAWLRQLAQETGASGRATQREVRLHLPAVELDELGAASPPSRLVEVVRPRLRGLVDAYAEVGVRAREGMIPPDAMLLGAGHNSLWAVGKTSLARMPVRFDVVAPEVAETIETRLHYLRAYRPEAVERWGLFVEDASTPFAYASFVWCDRAYYLESLAERAGVAFTSVRVAHLARAYGLEATPVNSVSKLVSLAAAELRKRGAWVVTTAVNPLLGFRGDSLRASGFTPFALCPVVYQYDSDGRIVTRRQGVGRESPWCRSPNVLVARGVRHSLSRKLSGEGTVIPVSPLLHVLSVCDLSASAAGTGASIRLEALRPVREVLERAWSEKTRYRAAIYRDRDPVSKGQCGVTSAYLARSFERFGWISQFCQGNVYFSGDTSPIMDHCWLTLRARHEAEADEVVVDLTADQTGYAQGVLCATSGELAASGVRYEEHLRTRPDEIDVASFRRRIEVLEQEVQVHGRVDDIEGAVSGRQDSV